MNLEGTTCLCLPNDEIKGVCSRATMTSINLTPYAVHSADTDNFEGCCGCPGMTHPKK